MQLMIKLYDLSDNPIEFKRFTFPGGEVGVKLLNIDSWRLAAPLETVFIEAHLTSAEEIIDLMMLKDALNRFGVERINLFMPYVPYGRQDRVCDKGEAFSLKVFAGLINNLGFNRVVVADPHSEVTGALFDRLEVISQQNIINRFQPFLARMVGGSDRRPEDTPIFVSPDAGANKKTASIAGYFSRSSFIRADKLRDLSTGKIVETIVYATDDEIKGRTFVIVDDICDGGASFTAIAKALKTRGAKTVILYVTHGIFSKGIDTLLQNGIDEIFTTDSFRLTPDDRVTTLKLTEEFKLN